MKSYKKELPGAGEILFEKSTRAKRLSISIRPGRGVRVAVPRGCSFAAAERFATDNLRWILAKQESQKERIDEQKKLEVPELPREEAKRILTARLELLSRETGLTYNRVFIKNQKTLWGSCSSRKNINLNIKLLSLPQHLRDYVILHELVHTRIMNHSSLFWQTLEHFLPQCRRLRRELRGYSPRGVE